MGDITRGNLVLALGASPPLSCSSCILICASVERARDNDHALDAPIRFIPFNSHSFASAAASVPHDQQGDNEEASPEMDLSHYVNQVSTKPLFLLGDQSTDKLAYTRLR